MADVKISQLPAATTPLTGAEQVPLVQGGVTKRTTVLDLSASQTLQTVTSNGATTTINSAFNGANIGTFSGVPAVTSTGSTVGLANSTSAAVLVADVWRGTANDNVSLGAFGYNWQHVYGTTFNVGSGTASMTASGNNLVLNAVAAAVAGVGFAPATDNLYFLGGSSLRWKALYLGDGTFTWNSYAIPAPTGGTTTFLRNDGTWAVPAGGGSGTVTSVAVSGGTTGLTTSGGPITTSGTITLAGTLAVANGGTGTTTPALVAGTNVTITGTWPNQTVNATGGSTVYPGAGIANSTGSAWGTSYSTTGTGTVLALATSPTLVTPVLGTPTSGDFSTGTFTWPTFNQNTTGTAANVTGTVAIGNGGTGQTTAAAAITALSGTQTSGYYLRSDGTNTLLAAIVAADVPTLNQNTTGSAGSVANTLTISSPLSGTSFNGSAAATIALSTGYGDTQNPFASKTANYVLAAPDGTAGAPTFRAIVAADIPTLNQNTTGTAANVTGTVAVANGGTGLTTTPANGALDIGNGTGFTRATLTAGTGITVTNASGAITIAAAGGATIGLIRAVSVNCILP